METENDPECCGFIVDKKYNHNQGPTDKQPDSSPMEERMRVMLEQRVGVATSPQTSMGDTMSTKPFFPTSR